jgi:hypothetical protein
LATEKLRESQPHKQAIEEMRFGGLLKMPNVSLRKGMLEDIASGYQADCRGFKLCGQIVNLLREDVTNIMALRTTGFDVENYIDTTKKSDIEIVNSDFFKRFADTNNKLELHKLESMISVKKTCG